MCLTRKYSMCTTMTLSGLYRIYIIFTVSSIFWTTVLAACLPPGTRNARVHCNCSQKFKKKKTKNNLFSFLFTRKVWIMNKFSDITARDHCRRVAYPEHCVRETKKYYTFPADKILQYYAELVRLLTDSFCGVRLSKSN